MYFLANVGSQCHLHVPGTVLLSVVAPLQFKKTSLPPEFDASTYPLERMSFEVNNVQKEKISTKRKKTKHKILESHILVNPLRVADPNPIFQIKYFFNF